MFLIFRKLSRIRLNPVRGQGKLSADNRAAVTVSITLCTAAVASSLSRLLLACLRSYGSTKGCMQS
jgi:hypothetical protein